MAKKLLSFIFFSLWMANAFCAAEFLEMRFTNRAGCALDSNKPSESAFLLISNMDVARSLYRLAKIKGEDPSVFTQNGIKVYRYSIHQMLQLIHKKLMKRELPLLPSDTTRGDVPRRYKKIMQQCRSDEYCQELDDYLESIWSISANNVSGKIAQLEAIDEFDPDIHFLDRKIVSSKSEAHTLTCSYLKKFSPLQAQLFGSRPTKDVLLKIGEAASHPEKFIADCDDFEAQENVKVAAFEISIRDLKKRSWNDQGFDYWNSIKMYFSWAFRHAPEMKTMAFPYQQLFSGVAIEETTLIAPNGCKSITLPKCDSDYLNQNTIREFAKSDFKKEAVNLDILSAIPDGPTKELMSDQFSEINRDILNFSEFKSSSDWLDNFRENFSAARSLMRKKLLLAVTNMDIVSKQIDARELTKSVLKHFDGLLAGTSEHASVTAEEQILLKNELYYLCSEFSFSGNEEIGLVKNKLDLLKKTTLLDQVLASVVEKSANYYFDYFLHVSNQINSFCSNIDQKKIWDSSFVLSKNGFSSWYIHKVYQGGIPSNFYQLQAEYLKSHRPMLAYAGFAVSKNTQDIVCESAPGCARLYLKSLIDLYAATQYADTFWNLNKQVHSPAIFNPYADRTACKIYDPWFKTKSTMFGFFTDAAQAGLSIVAPGMIYAKLDLEPGKVVSFNQLVKDGKIQYDVKYDKEKINAGLAMDFGKLLGIPCGVSISRTEKENPYNYYQFQGIGVRSCRENEISTIEVTNPSDIRSIPSKKNSQCLVCTLNFETVSSLGGRVLPGVNSTFFLVRALFRLYKGFTDPLNIPRSWSVDPKLVKATLEKFDGDIPKECVFPLSHSQSCQGLNQQNNP